MWFTENPWPPMLFAGLSAVVCFGMWNSDRRNRHLFWALAMLCVTGAIYAVERVIVTDGEKLQDDVILLCDQFRKRDPATLDHFSANALELRALCKSAMAMVEIRDDLRLTDFHTTFASENSRANVHFRANATISVMSFSGHHSFRCLLGFRKEAGTWNIIEIQRLDPFNGDKIETMAHK